MSRNTENYRSIPRSKELKRQARIILEGNYTPAVSLCAVITLISSALLIVLDVSGLGYSGESLNLALYLVVSFIILLISSLFQVGLIYLLYYLMTHDKERPTGAMLYAFRSQPDTYILTYAFRYLVSYVWFIPAVCVYMLTPVDAEAPTYYYYLGAALILALIAIVLSVACSLPFTVTTYVQIDDPGISARDALKESFRITKGYRFRIMRLYLSFIPLYLVGTGAFGVGLLWVQPYFYATMGRMYMEIKEQNY